MAAEEIAKVVEDLRRGNIHREGLTNLTKLLLNDGYEAIYFHQAPVVDVTALYNRFMASDGKDPYEGYLAAPPWTRALLGYVNAVGNVSVIDFSAVELNNDDDLASIGRWQPAVDQWHYGSETDDYPRIEWERVRWLITAFYYAGGHHSTGQPVPTAGPLHVWRIPVYPDGVIADIQWNQLHPKLGHELFSLGMMTMLETLTMCNCVNVAIAEPERPRHERRRLERTGVSVSEIHIRPTSKSYRGIGTPLSQIPISAHAVRGHYANYGPKYGRGLLFGKYEGRFWMPQHVRGSATVGEVVQSYVVEGE